MSAAAFPRYNYIISKYTLPSALLTVQLTKPAQTAGSSLRPLRWLLSSFAPYPTRGGRERLYREHARYRGKNMEAGKGSMEGKLGSLKIGRVRTTRGVSEAAADEHIGAES